MHMGNLLAMLLAWLDIRARGGRMIFRMEDLDPARSKPEYVAALTEDLRWLGLDWDEGFPEDPAYAQSRRNDIYEDAFAALRARGLVYPCWCSRAERLAASAPHPGEPRSDPGCRCARMTRAEREAMAAAGRRPAWKVRVPNEVVTVIDGHYGAYSQDLAAEGDFIIRRADGVFAYQLAVSVDDMLMGVTRVVRGRDLLSSAPRQSWLIRTLGGTPPDYCHTPLLVSADGGKLSKRLGSLSTQVLRESLTPEALTGRLAHLCGLAETDAPVTPRALAAAFDWDRVTRRDIRI